MESLLEDNEQKQPQTVDEEYALWKKNSESMYDYVSETKLGWPSMVVEWLPTPDPSLERQELLVGTLTDLDGKESNVVNKNYLKFCKIDYPSGEKQALKVFKKIEHDGEINKLKINPFDSKIVSTINEKSEINVFDRKRGFLGKLKGVHSEDDGFGLSFSKLDSSLLISAASDGKRVLWDITKMNKVAEDSTHTAGVNCIEFSSLKKSLFASVSDDSTLLLSDTRTTGGSFETVHSLKHTSVLNAVSFSPFSENLLACGGEDSLIALYDLRYFKQSNPLHVMAGHEDNITNLQWADYQDGILVSSGEDRKLIYWDINKIGNEQTPDDAEDGVPEKLFVHGGHRSIINDFSLHPSIPWLTVSTEEENYTQIYKPTDKITNPEWMEDISLDDLEN
ncbi:hypothetical protein FOG48_02665 [Hanseniaspora uvarum]|nr:hypothetical protein FOG48_02665 [Hanseniaspora uvarum]